MSACGSTCVFKSRNHIKLSKFFSNSIVRKGPISTLLYTSAPTFRNVFGGSLGNPTKGFHLGEAGFSLDYPKAIIYVSVRSRLRVK